MTRFEVDMMKRILFLLLVCLTACTGRKVAEPHSEAELAGLTVACRNGSHYQTMLERRDDIRLFLTNNDPDALLAVRQGRADVFVTDEMLLGEEEMARWGVKKVFRGEDSYPICFGIRKGNDELRRSLNAFLAATPVEAIVSHYTHGTAAVPEPPYEVNPKAKPLRFVFTTNMAPVSYMDEDGKWVGIDIDLIRRFAHRLGRPLELHTQALSSALVALQSGQCDLIASYLELTEERQQIIDFSLPYYDVYPGFFVLDSGANESATMRERVAMNLKTENRWMMIGHGLLETILITLFSILLGSALGCLFCRAKGSKREWVRNLTTLYSGFIGSMPTLVLLLILYYVVFARTGIPATIVAIITFAMCFASSSGNLFYSSISSVPKGQIEAGLSLGFTRMQTFRYIVLPQAMKKGLPAFAGDCVGLLKGTSIVGYISIHDLTHVSDLIRARTFDAIIPLLVATVIYFFLAWALRRGIGLLMPKDLSTPSKS